MENSRIALFPGSFDPITTGHVEIIERGLLLFDKVIIAVGVNSQKKYLFPVEKRISMIRKSLPETKRLEIVEFSTLTVDLAKKSGAGYLLRGLRNSIDFEYEKQIEINNKHLDKDLETVYLISTPQTGGISSTIVRELIRYKADLSGLVPQAIIGEIYG